MKLNKRNKFLLLGFLVALYICYSFAFANTIDIYKQYQLQNETLNTDDFSANTLKTLFAKEKQLDVLLAQKQSVNPESSQNELLKLLNIYAKKYNLKIVDFNEPHSLRVKGKNETSYIFTLQGSYNGCISLLNKIESSNIGAIKHVNFNKKRNYKSNSDELFVEIVLVDIFT